MNFNKKKGSQWSNLKFLLSGAIKVNLAYKSKEFCKLESLSPLKEKYI